MQARVTSVYARQPSHRAGKPTECSATLPMKASQDQPGSHAHADAALRRHRAASVEVVCAGVTPVSSKEATLAEWGPALRAASDNQSTESARVTSDNVHRLKLAVRSFAERHQQQQVVLA